MKLREGKLKDLEKQIFFQGKLFNASTWSPYICLRAVVMNSIITSSKARKYRRYLFHSYPGATLTSGICPLSSNINR